MPGRALHLLSQRPTLTGSGVTLDALALRGSLAGWEQRAVVGVPAGGTPPAVAGVPSEQVRAVEFGGEALPFPLPGMSDVMPYESSRFSRLGLEQLEGYRDAWRKAIRSAAEDFEPDVVHSHHVWIMSALVKDVLPGVPVVTHCHATGLRQMELCPHLADEVRRGCRRNERFVVLSKEHAQVLGESLGVAQDRVHVVGAGFDEAVFHPRGRVPEASARLLYAGKLARAKGLPWLLDAVSLLAERVPGLVLHVAGGGAGPEADALREQMGEMGSLVEPHGRLSQGELAALMRRCDVFVLPSFYEGLPLVLVEAAACGCRGVATRLSGIEKELAPRLGPWLDLVDTPRLVGPDEPRPEDLPAFVSNLASTLEAAVGKSGGRPSAGALETFTWEAVFARVEQVWLAEAAEGRG